MEESTALEERMQQVLDAHSPNHWRLGAPLGTAQLSRVFRISRVDRASASADRALKVVPYADAKERLALEREVSFLEKTYSENVIKYFDHWFDDSAAGSSKIKSLPCFPNDGPIATRPLTQRRDLFRVQVYAVSSWSSAKVDLYGRCWIRGKRTEEN